MEGFKQLVETSAADVKALRQGPSNGMAAASAEIVAFNKILKESWKKNVGSAEIDAMLTDHANNMHNILGTFDYEIAGIRNVILHSKKLARGDLVKYMRMVEGLTYAYKNMLGSELAGTIAAGMTLKAHDLHSLNRYYVTMVDFVESKIKYYEGMGKSKERRVELLDNEIVRLDSSILRFLNKKKIRGIRKRIGNANNRIGTLNEKAEKYRKMRSTIKTIVGL